MEEGARPLSDIPAINRFLSYCRIRTVPSKTVVIHAGDLPDVLYYIVSGSVEVMIEDEEGNEMVLAYLNKGQFFGEMGLFYEQPTRSAWVRTRQQCELAEMTYPRFRQLAAESPGLVFELATQLATRLDRTNRKLGDLAFVDVTGRVAHAIMDLCSEPDAMTHPEGMQIKVSRQELSRLVGCSREMAGRVLKVLEDQGLLRATGKTIVVFGARPKMKTKPPLAAAAGRAGRHAAIAVRTTTTTTMSTTTKIETSVRLEPTHSVILTPACLAVSFSLTLPFAISARIAAIVARVILRSRRSPSPPRTCRRRRARSRRCCPTFTPPSISSRISRPLARMRSRACAQLVERRRDELLAAEARVHRHDQDHVDLVDHVIEPVERRRRIEHQAGLAAVLADQLDRAIDVLARFRMERDPGGAGLREVRNDAIDRLHHQVHVDRRGDAVLAQRLAHQRADGEIRHVVIVHHVEVDQVGAGSEHRLHFLAEAREVGGEDGRSDPGRSWNGTFVHFLASTSCRARRAATSYAARICRVFSSATFIIDSGRPLRDQLVGMILIHEAAIGLRDLGVGRRARHAQHFVGLGDAIDRGPRAPARCEACCMRSSASICTTS